MKKLLLAFAATALFAACSPIYYQIYQTKPITEGAAIDKEAIVFANKDCRVTYNFYSNGGDAGFLLTNLTDSIMYVHMDESFFVLNGVTNDYYRQSFDIQGQSRTIGSSLNISLNNGVESKKKKNREAKVSSESATTSSHAHYSGTFERAVLTIPPHASRQLGNYNINAYVLELCGAKSNPKGRKNSGRTYTENDTPLTFSNTISYNIGTKGNRTLINTQFYVSEILNMTRKAMMTETRLTDPCGKVKKGKVETMSMDSPDRFYLLYRYDKKLDRPVNIR